MLYPLIYHNNIMIEKDAMHYIVLDNSEEEKDITEDEIVYTLYGAFEDIPYYYDRGKKRYLFIATDVLLSNDKCFINGIEFRRIPSFSSYFISGSGLVYCTMYKKILRPKLSRYGYYLISIVNDFHARKTVALQRLVFSAWNGDLIEGMVIDHIDGKKWNNHFTNLDQVSSLENTRRAILNGQITHTIWSKSEIEEICEYLKSEMSYEKIFKNYEDKCSLTSFKYLCSNLVHNKHSWLLESKNAQIVRRPANIKYDDQTVHEIFRLLENGYSISDTSKICGVPLKYVSALKRGNTRKEIRKKYNIA